MTSYGLFPRVSIIHGSLYLTVFHSIMTLLTSNLFCMKTVPNKAVCYGNHVRSSRHRSLDLFHHAVQMAACRWVPQPSSPKWRRPNPDQRAGPLRHPPVGPSRRSRQGGCAYSCIWRCAEYCARILKLDSNRRDSYTVTEKILSDLGRINGFRGSSPVN